MNLPTAIVLTIVAALVVIDIIALRRDKGKCSCSANGKKSTNCSGCAGCSANCPLKR